MKVELTNKEIESIINLMDTGMSYLISHVPSLPLSPTKYRREIINIDRDIVSLDELKAKLREYLKPIEEEKWTAIKIDQPTGEEIKIGEFLDRKSAINAISAARTIDLKDKKAYFEYLIESRF